MCIWWGEGRRRIEEKQERYTSRKRREEKEGVMGNEEKAEKGRSRGEGRRGDQRRAGEREWVVWAGR